MSQFGFFNVPQPQPAPARPAYDPYPVSHPAFDAPRPRVYDDPYVRCPSPPRGGFFGAAPVLAPAPASVYVPLGPMERHPLDRHYQPAPVYAEPPLIRREPDYFDRLPAPQPMARDVYDRRDPYPSSWRPEPPREERREFFTTATDTWRSAPTRGGSPTRDRRFNTDAFASRRDYSPDRRRTFRDDRSPIRRDDRATRYDDRDKRDRRRSGDRERKRERSRSRDRKRDERRDERTESKTKSKDRDSKESTEKAKENGEKKRRVDDEKDKKEDTEKEKIGPRTPEEANVEPENKEDDRPKSVEIIEDDEFADEYEEVEEEEKEASSEKAVEEPVKEEPRRIDDSWRKAEDKTEKTDTRQSRIRSPSLKRDDRSRSHSRERRRLDDRHRSYSDERDDDRSRSNEKDEHSRSYSDEREEQNDHSRSHSNDKDDRSRSHSVEKKSEGFKILTDATFEEVHLFGAKRPYNPNYKSGGRRPHDDPEPKSTKFHSRGASWAEQWKAKVMITKTAALTAGPPAPILPPVVAVAPAPRDLYASRGHAYADDPRAVYPSARPAPSEVYAYGEPPHAPVARAAYGAPPRAEPPLGLALDPREEEWKIRARELYERRLADEQRRALSPPPSRRELHDRREAFERAEYERSLIERGREERQREREYYEERYGRAAHPDERGGARYAAERPRYEDAPHYEKMPARGEEGRDRDRRPAYRPRSPPPSAVIPPSARSPLVVEPLIEPLEDEGWDDVARMLTSPADKVVIEKKAKKPLIASVPPVPVHPPKPHRPRGPTRPDERDVIPIAFFSQPPPSTFNKIAFADSRPFEERPRRKEGGADVDAHRDRPTFFPAPAPTAAVAPRLAPTDEAYGRAMSYEALASSNGAAAYRSGPAPGWERGSRGY